MKVHDNISMPHTYIHTYIHTYLQAETNMLPTFSNLGAKHGASVSEILALFNCSSGG